MLQRTSKNLIPIRQYLSSGISDEVALFLQLCHYLFQSGFLFDDATPDEVKAGEAIIASFIEQEPNLLKTSISQQVCHHFIAYIQSYAWDDKTQKKKVRLKVSRAFERLIEGGKSAGNIERNVHLGLTSGLQTFSNFNNYLYAYYQLFLEEQLQTNQKHYSPEDLLQMRSQLLERLEGKKFVDWLLEAIEAKHHGKLPTDLSQVRGDQSIQFVRPSALLTAN